MGYSIIVHFDEQNMLSTLDIKLEIVGVKIWERLS